MYHMCGCIQYNMSSLSEASNSQRGMMLLATVIQLIVILTLYFILTMFVSVISRHVHSKPPLLISMVDLINIDLARAYYAATSCASLIHIITTLDVAHVPPLLAVPITFVFSVSGICLAAYGSISVIAHYVMIFKCQPISP